MYSGVTTAKTKDCKITLSIHSRLDHVWMVRAALSGILRDIDIPENDAFLLQLAVSEIVSNAIEHGYRGEMSHSVDVSLHRGDGELWIDIADDAPAIPVERMNRMLRNETDELEVDNDWPSRGHGLQIVQKAIDSLEFSRIGDRNHVTLRKRISEIAAHGR